MRIRSFNLFCFLLIFFIYSHFFLCTAADHDFYLQGKWSVKYLLRDPLDILIVSQVHSSGFSQEVTPIHRGYFVTVTCDLTPFGISLPFSMQNKTLPGKFSDPDLIEALRCSKTMCEAVRATNKWLEQNVPYSDLRNSGEQTGGKPVAVGGNCVSRAKIWVELLQELNIASRTVSGCLIKNNDGIFHRWVEIEYPGIGGFASEPGVTQDFIDPYHLIIGIKAGRETDVSCLSDVRVQVDIMQEEKAVWITDEDPAPASPGIYLRRREDHQFSSTLVGQIDSKLNCAMTVTLVLNDRKKKLHLEKSGIFSFPGLPAGAYQLKIFPECGHEVVLSGYIGIRQILRRNIVISGGVL